MASSLCGPKVEPRNESTAEENLLRQQSIPVDGDPVVRRSPLSDKLESVYYDDVTTVYEGFQRGLRLSGDSPCFGKREGAAPFQWITYNEAHERAYNFGSGLVKLGSDPSQKSFIGIYSRNCIEWSLTDLACQMFSMISVPIYDTHGPDACVYVINHAEIKTVVCHPSKLKFFLEHAKDTPEVNQVITIGDVSEEEKENAKLHGLEVFTFLEVEEKGKNDREEKTLPKPTDIYTISYTSGTTGTPKGVIETHANQIATATATIWHSSSAKRPFLPSDRHLSILPLAHVFERCTHTILLQTGAQIGFFRGDIKLALEDLQELKPTIFIAVPRLLNRIYDKVMSQVSESKLKSWMFSKALKSKETYLQKNMVRDNTFWDKVVFKKVRGNTYGFIPKTSVHEFVLHLFAPVTHCGTIVKMLFGGEVRSMMSGAAPLSSKVMMFFKCAMGNCLIIEAYGQTETTAACAFQYGTDLTAAGHVGGPVVCNHIKLADVPEKNYFAKDLKGEICVKGSNVTPGYYKQPEKTAELFDKDGWMHTGDIGMFLENGALKITDRVKDIFKLSQGEYIAPGKLENIIQRSHLVAQAFVHGESLKTFVVAIVVPDEEVVMKWAKQKSVQGDFKVLCKNQELNKAILDDVLKVSNEAKLNGFEKVKAIHLYPELFSIENGFLTATYKTKRPAVLQAFKEEIEDLYATVEGRTKLLQSEIAVNLQIDQTKLNKT